MPVSDTHPQYAEFLPVWQETDDATDGSPALRKKNRLYLPEPFMDSEPERYAIYCDSAYYVNITGRTESTLIGMVFRKAASYTLPTEMEYLLENFDGGGNSLEQVAKKALSQNLRKRRFLILVDAGKAPVGATKEQKDAMGVMPFAATYDAENLINWDFKTVNGKRKLVRAVLKESVNVAQDEFGHKYEDQYRVLRLRNGVYTQQLYGKDERPSTEEIVITTRSGSALDYIPLHGVRDLTVAPLQPIAETNIAHYRNTAKLEDLVSLLGGANLHLDVGQTDIDVWKQHNPGSFQLSGRIGTLTQGGKLEIVQAEDRPMIRSVRDDKIQEMVALGASIIQREGQTETAEAARIAASSQTSQLDMVVNDQSEDFEAALESCARLLDINTDQVTYKLSQDFWEASLDAQTLQAIIQGRTTGTYGDRVALHMIRRGRIELPEGMTDDDIREDAANTFVDDEITAL